MVATKAKIGLRQYMKAKPTKWGVKLFVNGYTIDFPIYTGKSRLISGQGLSYDVVSGLMDNSYLGRGYHFCRQFLHQPKTQREGAFVCEVDGYERGLMEELSAELCGVPIGSFVPPKGAQCLPESMSCADEEEEGIDSFARRRSGDTATKGQRKCVLCKKRSIWKCARCDVTLCLVAHRNCFSKWHSSRT
ncbi:hypothetical protein F7725_019219 [Dissostichus mawsoni]|uniref:PiggyBac transposable element-derived protein domain-containing protein n=1 Tax=Dissostichus mawsoni TaxID=36200 RepID=A0A7J5YJG4_DISMA|nr:hypothetical protein F7725_019219 [Dissostichus mawsoni]